MCELKVYLDGEKVFDDAVYVKSDNGKITLRNILGEMKQLENCQIAEVDITSEKLTLRSSES